MNLIYFFIRNFLLIVLTIHCNMNAMETGAKKPISGTVEIGDHRIVSTVTDDYHELKEDSIKGYAIPMSYIKQLTGPLKGHVAAYVFPDGRKEKAEVYFNNPVYNAQKIFNDVLEEFESYRQSHH